MWETRLLLLEDFKPGGAREPDIEDLRRQLTSISGVDRVTLTPNGRSTVLANVPAATRPNRARLKALLNERLHGWRVIEEQSYGLPSTF
jgi:hypothetical protein